MKSLTIGAALVVAVLLSCPALALENTDPLNDDSQYAWSENTGWVNAEPLGNGGTGLEALSNCLLGYAWSENIGYISLSCLNSDSCLDADYGVYNDGSGNLSGHAWSENAGWIKFAGTAGTGDAYGVTIDQDTGDFDGYAWGENVGYIRFASLTAPEYKVQADLCPADPAKTGPGVCGCGTPDSDTDTDGVLLCDDNCPLTPNPGQDDTDGDGKGDACETMGDLSGDGKVDMADFYALRGCMGTRPGAPGFQNEGDLNGDGVINWTDLRLLLRQVR